MPDSPNRPVRRTSGALSTALGGLLLVAAATACDDPLRPAEVAGEYALETVAGEPIPAVLYGNEEFEVRVLADTLRLHADGTGSRTTLQERDDADDGAPPEAPTRSERAFDFDIDDGRIEIAFRCPINALCLAPPHLVARRVSGALHVHTAVGGERVPRVYTPTEAGGS